MARFFRRYFHGILRKGNTIFLAVCFLSGFLIGVLYAFVIETDLPLMHSVFACSVSIVCSLGILLFPFLLSVVIIYFFDSSLLYLLCFSKALVFAFVSVRIIVSFSGGGWLLRILFMFSDIFTMPVLYFLWQRHLSEKTTLQMVDAIALFLLIIAIIFLDRYFIFPLTHRLF